MAEKKKSGGGERKRTCPHCSKEVAAWAKYCPECGKPEKPEFLIEVRVSEGGSEVQILVQTYKNNEQVSCNFVWQVDGEDFSKTKKTNDRGFVILKLPFSSKKRKASFHIIGGMADIKEVDIPAKPEKPYKKAVNPNEGFFGNLMGR